MSIAVPTRGQTDTAGEGGLYTHEISCLFQCHTEHTQSFRLNNFNYRALLKFAFQLTKATERRSIGSRCDLLSASFLLKVL